MNKFSFLLLLTLWFKPQTRVELNILISKTNHIYWYQSPLKSDASNFNMATSKTFSDLMLFVKSENHVDDLNFILKIQEKDYLNEDSKKFIDFIKGQKYYKAGKLTVSETQLIEATEKANGY